MLFRSNIQLRFIVRRETVQNNLNLIADIRIKQRAERPVDQPARQHDVARRTSFTAEERTGNPSPSVHAFFIFDRQREEILPFANLFAHCRRAEDDSWAGPRIRDAVARSAGYYAALLARPGAARAALSSVRNLILSRAEVAALTDPVSLPVLSVQGEVDPVQPAQAYARDTHHVAGRLAQVTIRGVTH